MTVQQSYYSSEEDETGLTYVLENTGAPGSHDYTLREKRMHQLYIPSEGVRTIFVSRIDGEGVDLSVGGESFENVQPSETVQSGSIKLTVQAYEEGQETQFDTVQYSIESIFLDGTLSLYENAQEPQGIDHPVEPGNYHAFRILDGKYTAEFEDVTRSGDQSHSLTLNLYNEVGDMVREINLDQKPNGPQSSSDDFHRNIILEDGENVGFGLCSFDSGEPYLTYASYRSNPSNICEISVENDGEQDERSDDDPGQVNQFSPSGDAGRDEEYVSQCGIQFTQSATIDVPAVTLSLSQGGMVEPMLGDNVIGRNTFDSGVQAGVIEELDFSGIQTGQYQLNMRFRENGIVREVETCGTVETNSVPASQSTIPEQPPETGTEDGKDTTASPNRATYYVNYSLSEPADRELTLRMGEDDKSFFTISEGRTFAGGTSFVGRRSGVRGGRRGRRWSGLADKGGGYT